MSYFFSLNLNKANKAAAKYLGTSFQILFLANIKFYKMCFLDQLCGSRKIPPKNIFKHRDWQSIKM